MIFRIRCLFSWIFSYFFFKSRIIEFFFPFLDFQNNIIMDPNRRTRKDFKRVRQYKFLNWNRSVCYIPIHCEIYLFHFHEKNQFTRNKNRWSEWVQKDVEFKLSHLSKIWEFHTNKLYHEDAVKLQSIFNISTLYFYSVSANWPIWMWSRFFAHRFKWTLFSKKKLIKSS